MFLIFFNVKFVLILNEGIIKMKDKTIKNSGSSYDKAVFIVLKISLIGVIILGGLSLFNILEGIWTVAFVALGLLTCTVLVILKGAQTGKRYAQGARHRRQKWFPGLFSKNESLADDVVRIWQEQ